MHRLSANQCCRLRAAEHDVAVLLHPRPQLLGQGGVERDVVDFQEEEDGDRVETNAEGVTWAKRASGRSASREEKGDLKRRSAHRR